MRSIRICADGAARSKPAHHRRVRGGAIAVAAAAAFTYTSVTPDCAAAAQLQQPPTSYPLCTADSLAGFPWTHHAFGHAIPGIALRNMTLSTCRVAGYPEVRAYEASGRPAAVDFVRTPFLDRYIYAYTVVPGAAVFFAFYGQAPKGEFDRNCVGITQVDVTLPDDTRAIDITMSTGTCGGRMSVSQMFPVSELSP